VTSATTIAITFFMATPSLIRLPRKSEPGPGILVAHRGVARVPNRSARAGVDLGENGSVEFPGRGKSAPNGALRQATQLPRPQ